jgi:hypothetical protein
MIGQSRGLWSGGVESELGSHGTMEMGDAILGHFLTCMYVFAVWRFRIAIGLCVQRLIALCSPHVLHRAPDLRERASQQSACQQSGTPSSHLLSQLPSGSQAPPFTTGLSGRARDGSRDSVALLAGREPATDGACEALRRERLGEASVRAKGGARLRIGRGAEDDDLRPWGGGGVRQRMRLPSGQRVHIVPEPRAEGVSADATHPIGVDDKQLVVRGGALQRLDGGLGGGEDVGDDLEGGAVVDLTGERRGERRRRM